MAAPKIARWTVPGVVAEARPLRTTKTNEIWAYVIKVMAIGGTYEVQTRSAGLFGLVGAGAEVVCAGGFEMFANALRLTLETLEIDGKTFRADPLDPTKTVAVPASVKP